ncbi:MAG TPA: S41 family peptidase [Chitinophagaceae bacterium]|nr:S41 family peptidase [Chitinophagaceae bacterium]
MRLTALFKLLFTTLLIFCCIVLYAQHKYSPGALKQDITFIKQQIFDAHANPFTELTRDQYSQVFTNMEAQITDSLTTAEFYKIVKPAVAWLSDEHAAISLPDSMEVFDTTDMLPPFTLAIKGSEYVIDDVFGQNNAIKPGDIIKQVNNMAIKALVQKNAAFTTGYPNQRLAKGMQYFGYLYGFGNKLITTYTITLQNGKTATLQGVSPTLWQAYINKNTRAGGLCNKKISYTKYGHTGYINACTFSTHNNEDIAWFQHAIDSIFDKIQEDGVTKLIIDASRNSGGNSGIGDMLIAHFYNKPYRTYQCNWRRSDEYLETIKRWGINNDEYAQKKPGDILHYDSDTITPATNGSFFNGKVYIVIGDGTFSSAIMFATIIKDNHIATLVGQTPRDGHPTHFGELYAAKTPNTHLQIRFGVKEWIRPAGETGNNTLQPDIELQITDPINIAAVEHDTTAK